MSRFRHEKRSRFVQLHHWMLGTPAWQSLDGNARAIYIEIAQRYAGPSSNNGRIPYAVREASVALKISKATASRALSALVERGFIVPTVKGAFSLKKRHATEWRLTEHPCDITNTPIGSKEFMRWQPPTPAEIERRRNDLVQAGSRAALPSARALALGDGREATFTSFTPYTW